VEVTITNTLEQEEIANNLQPLLKHLGDHLKNNNITIEYKFVEAEKKEIIYSPSDKFNYLSAKNPALIKLRETFALELE